MSNRLYKKDVLIVGAGPAGMVLALLLAKRGLNVLVLERNPDFEREFRGEVLQPRFWHSARESGLLELFVGIPHEQFDALRLYANGKLAGIVSAAAIDSDFPYMTWMTQPHMLHGLLAAAKQYPNFSIEFSATLKSLRREGEKVSGASFQAADGQLREVHCSLVVGCDGRFSAIRRLGGYNVEHKSHQFDVMWFESSRPESYTHGADFFIGGIVNCLVLPKFQNKIQCGIIIPPGTAGKYRELGPYALAEKLNSVHPMFKDFSTKLVDYKSSTLLSAVIEFVECWAKDGLLVIGDTAHTMSPAGALGVTIAIESAIVADQVIAKCFRSGDFSASVLAEVQRLREPEVLRVQKIQKRIGSILSFKLLPRSLVSLFMAIMVKSGLAVRLMRGILTRKPGDHLLKGID